MEKHWAKLGEGMRRARVVPFLCAAVVALAGCEELKVSSFGYDPVDSTDIIQKALDSGVPRIVFDRQAGPWITRPLRVRSNQELVFEEGVTLLAKRGEYKSRNEPLMSVPSRVRAATASASARRRASPAGT